jgi:hypothetical protein
MNLLVEEDGQLLHLVLELGLGNLRKEVLSTLLHISFNVLKLILFNLTQLSLQSFNILSLYLRKSLIQRDHIIIK